VPGQLFLGEIHEQPRALLRLLEHDDEYARVAAVARERGRLVRFVGHGSSDNAASYGVYAFGLLPRWTAVRDSITLTVHYDTPIDLSGSMVIGLSQSGQTPDVVEYLLRARKAGAFTVAITNDAEWKALCEALGDQTLSTDARFASFEQRTANDAALREKLTAIFKTRTAADWMKALDAAGAPAEMSDPLFSQRLFDDPLLRERGWTVGFDHKDFGFFEQAGVLVNLSETPGEVQGTSLISGENTKELLAEFGFSESEIDELVADKVVRQA
jgi:crotonobetainyl-CoA:carnitine CoA-transferase CaiB-like acyl-CoA transferase